MRTRRKQSACRLQEAEAFRTTSAINENADGDFKSHLRRALLF